MLSQKAHSCLRFGNVQVESASQSAAHVALIVPWPICRSVILMADLALLLLNWALFIAEATSGLKLSFESSVLSMLSRFYLTKAYGTFRLLDVLVCWYMLRARVC